jgi:hypothetical protein
LIAHVMAWHDPESGDYRALIDLVRPDGHRTPGGAACGATEQRCGEWITAIILDLGVDDEDIETTNLGEMSRPSFAAVRAKAALVDMQRQGAD